MKKYPQINVRINEDLIKRIDDWRRLQEDLPGRPEAMRRLIELALVRRVKGMGKISAPKDVK